MSISDIPRTPEFGAVKTISVAKLQQAARKRDQLSDSGVIPAKPGWIGVPTRVYGQPVGELCLGIRKTTSALGCRPSHATYSTIAARFAADRGFSARALCFRSRRPGAEHRRTGRPNDAADVDGLGRRRRVRTGGAASTSRRFPAWARRSRPLIRGPGSKAQSGSTINGRRIRCGTSFSTSATAGPEPPAAIPPARPLLLPPASLRCSASYYTNVTHTANSSATQATEWESHLVADFMIGRDFGLRRPQAAISVRHPRCRSPRRRAGPGKQQIQRAPRRHFIPALR